MPSNDLKWGVVHGWLSLTNDSQVKASCHHSRSRSNACGGCYARLHYALEKIRVCLAARDWKSALQIIDTVNIARNAENKNKKGKQ